MVCLRQFKLIKKLREVMGVSKLEPVGSPINVSVPRSTNHEKALALDNHTVLKRMPGAYCNQVSTPDQTVA